MIKPKHSLESVVNELVTGLRNGSLTLDEKGTAEGFDGSSGSMYAHGRVLGEFSQVTKLYLKGQFAESKPTS